MRQSFKSASNSPEEINFSKIFDLFQSRWYFVVISLLVSLVLCKLYLRYTKPVFQAVASVRVEEDDNLQSFGLMQAFGFGNWTDNIQSEIQLIRSRSMVSEALKVMDIHCLYYLVGTVITAEMYRDDSPFLVVYDSTTTAPYGTMISMRYQGGNKYTVAYVGNEENGEVAAYFGEKVKLGEFEFQVVKRETSRYQLLQGVQYRFQPVNQLALITRATNGLTVEQSGYLVPILKITHQDFVPKFATEFINTLVEVYQRRDISRKTQAASQALKFIQEQIDTIKISVGQAENIMTQFKEEKEFVDVTAKMTFDMEFLKRYEESKSELTVLLMDIGRLQQNLAKGDTTLSIPYSIQGESDPVLLALLTSYNGIIQERQTALRTYTASHPRILDFDQKLEGFRASINENIRAFRKSIEDKVTYFNRESELSRDGLRSIPRTQAMYQSLLREFEVKEKILSTLLENKAEAQIAKASIVSSVQILDRAMIPSKAVSPIAQKVYIIGCGLGISFGLLLILLSGMLKSTLSYREEIERISVTPIIGVVNRSQESLKNKYPRLQILDNPKSSLSESIRSIRTNMQFVAADKTHKMVAVTSTISGEGKSFITINLGGMISLLGLRVVILDMDLRKPKLHYSFGHDNSVGLSTYLVGQNKLEEVLTKTEMGNLWIIPSGPIPPNPAELVQSQRMEDLLTKLLEDFDYVLVDTPPIGLVTDGTTILKRADIALYVIRADYSKRSFAQNADHLTEEQNIRNLYIIFNSVSATNRRYGAYGYKVYGSGYYSDDRPEYPAWQFWKRWLR
jgi:tyrosine-protein kinase Etk/Wzc